MAFNVGAVNVGHETLTIIAEAGVNHNGNLGEAKQLALIAKEHGADIIKFQTYKSEKLSSPKAVKFWDKERDNSVFQEETYSNLDRFEESDYRELKLYCDSIGIEFLSTPFDLDSVGLLVNIGVNGMKIASCDITNFPLLEKVALTNLPIFLSTGASNLDEIEDAVTFIRRFHNKISLLHCVLSYPTKNMNANILSVRVLSQKFPDIVIGYSDHTREVYSAMGAVALGARVIEKHFTLARDDVKPGDHWFAVDPIDLGVMVEGSRAVLASLGVEDKVVLDCELKAREQARRSIHMNVDVKKSQAVSADDFIMLRPGTGLPPNRIESFIGKKYARDLSRFEQIDETHFE